MQQDGNSEQPAAPTPPTPDGAQNTDSTGSANTVPYDRFKQVNDERKQLEARLAKYEAEEKKRQEKEAIEAGEFEKVIADLRPQAERAAKLEKTLLEYLQKELDGIPEAMRGLVPDGDAAAKLAWINQAKAAGLFNPATAPNLDAGVRGDSRIVIKTTPEQERMAALAKEHGYDVKPDALTKRALELEEQRQRRPQQHKDKE